MMYAPAIAQQQSGQVVSHALPSDAFARFMRFSDTSASSVSTYRRSLLQFFRWASEEGIVSPTREDVMRYRESLRSRLKPTTVQNYICALRIFFSWAESEGIYPDITRKLKGAKVSRTHKKDRLIPSQVKAILDSIDRSTPSGARDYAIFRLMVTCGLRTIEVSRMDVTDLTVRRGNAVVMVLGKGYDEKIPVQIPPIAERAIREYWAMAGINSGAAFQSTSRNGKGSRISQRSVSGIIKTILKAAGYDSPSLTAHSLRHTAVTTAIQSGQSLQTAKSFARHSDVNTTMIYFHEDEDARNECAFANERAFE